MEEGVESYLTPSTRLGWIVAHAAETCLLDTFTHVRAAGSVELDLAAEDANPAKSGDPPLPFMW